MRARRLPGAGAYPAAFLKSWQPRFTRVQFGPRVETENAKLAAGREPERSIRAGDHTTIRFARESSRHVASRPRGIRKIAPIVGLDRAPSAFSLGKVRYLHEVMGCGVPVEPTHRFRAAS